MDVYSTWNLLCGVLGGWRGEKRTKRITLRPGTTADEWPGVTNEQDQFQEILLGKPIARITDADMFDEACVENLTKVIGDWVALDRTNIVNRHAGINWVVGPLNYGTGQSPYAEGKGGVVFYWHRANLAQCSANLGRVATALRLVLRDGLTETEQSQQPWLGRISALQDVLQSHWEMFDEPVRQFLIGQGLGPGGH